jgi:hypothetical protein
MYKVLHLTEEGHWSSAAMVQFSPVLHTFL